MTETQESLAAPAKLEVHCQQEKAPGHWYYRITLTSNFPFTRWGGGGDWVALM